MFSNKILCKGTYFFLLLTAESAEIAEILLKTNCTNFTNVYSTLFHVHICWAFSSL